MARAKVLPLRSKISAFQLDVRLEDITPPVWRRLRVASSLSLRELHHILQIAFGWNDSHLHEFAVGKRRFGMPDPMEDLDEPPLDERDFQLVKLIGEGDRFEYVYDFGDDWRHRLFVEKGLTGEFASKAECLDGARSGPPDDCGGPGGYEHLIEVLDNPRHEEYGDLREWAGPDFEPERFNVRAINLALRGAGSPAFRRRREAFYDGH